MKEKKKKPWLSLVILSAIFVLAGITWFCLWLFIWRFEVTTDDAYVHGNIVPIASEIIAPIETIYVKEGDFVHEGDLLVDLNPTEALANLESAQGALAFAVRNYFQLKEQLEAAKETLKIKQTQKELAHYTFFHKSNLEGTGVLAGADIQGAQTSFEIAQSELFIAEAQYKALLTQLEGTTVRTHPLVQEAQGQLIAAYLNLQRTKVRSPTTGYVGIREVQPGEFVMPGKVLVSVIPLSQIWVEANYKESELRHLGVGQEVKLYSDLYGKSVHYKGIVRGFSPGTGSSFSFLKPQNATGNWIKVVQRVPVMIELCPRELKEHPLLLGVSMHSKVIVDDKLPILTEAPPDRILSTSIFQNQKAEAEALVEKIIAQNSFCSKKLLTLLTGGRF